MWTPVITIVQRWFSPQRRGLALGILSTGYGLGFATMGVVFPWIVNHFSWRFGWYYLGTGMLVMVFINGFLLRSSPEDAGLLPWGKKEHESNMPSVEAHPFVKEGIFRTVFRSRTFWIIGLSYLLIAYSLYGITTFMVDYAKYQLGFALEKASFLATIHGFSQVIGVLIIVPMSDYLTRKKTLILSNAVIMVCLMGILFGGRSWGILIVLIGFMGAFYGSIWPLYGACAGDYFPREFMGTVVGAWTPLYGFGAIVVHWITGMIRDATGSYDYAFIICIITIAFSIGFLSFVKSISNNDLSTS
jgi:sugar phosphate permease